MMMRATKGFGGAMRTLSWESFESSLKSVATMAPSAIDAASRCPKTRSMCSKGTAFRERAVAKGESSPEQTHGPCQEGSAVCGRSFASDSSSVDEFLPARAGAARLAAGNGHCCKELAHL